MIGIADQGSFSKLILTFGVLRGKDMALKSLGAFDLTRACLLESFGCAFVCF